MYVKLNNGRKIGIGIHHERKDLEENWKLVKSLGNHANMLDPRENFPYTSCMLWEGDTFLGGGIAYCSPLDNFSKKYGTKEALRRALKDAGFTKEERTQIWERIRHGNHSRKKYEEHLKKPTIWGRLKNLVVKP